jgi:predicted acetyltransferase
MELEIREVREEEIQKVKLMVSKAFSPNPDVKIEDQGFFKQLEYVPLLSPEYFRAGFIDGQPMTSVMAVRFITAFGIVPMKIAGYTGMGTDRSARGKGYASKLLQEFEKFLEKRGFDGIVLHSAADMLYKKNGFEIVFGFGNFSIAPEGLEKYLQSEMENYKSRNFKTKIIKSVKDFPQIIDITIKIDQVHRNLYPITFNVIKNRMFWEQYLNYFFANGFSIALLSEPEYQGQENQIKQRAIAYMLYKIEKMQPPEEHFKLSIYELPSTDHSRYISAYLIKEIIESVKYSTPIKQIEGSYQHGRHDLSDLVTKCEGTTYTSLTSKNMFHIINIPSFLKKMEPEFVRRLEETKKSHNHKIILKVKESGLELLFRIENNMISITEHNPNEQETLAKITIEHEAFYALIFGSFEPKDLLEDCEFENTEKTDLIELLAKLFPFSGPVWPALYHY